jgi:PKD repeat protein
MVCGQCPPYWLPVPQQAQSNVQSNLLGQLTDPSILTSKGIQIPSWTWKTVVVLDRPGQGLEDVSAATPVYAILTPNIPEPTLAEFQNGVQNPLDTIAPLSSARPLITTQAQWRNWETWRVTVDQLEALLQTTPGLSNFDLMPDVRQNIQNAIESALSPVVTVPNFPPEADDSDSSVEGESNGEEPPSSPLLAAENGNLNTSIFNGMGSLQESSIWESGVAKEGTFVPSSSIVGSSHIGSSQVNPSHVGSTEVGFHQLSTDQLGSFKSSTTQVSTSETGSSQVSERKITSNQFSPTESAGTHIVGTEISAAEIAIRKVDSSNGLSDGIVLFPTSSSTQVGISKFDSKEIFLSSGIASEKFISGYLDHNSSPNVLTNIYSTAQSIWHSNTNLNLNFEITNLPTGQLAEATITGYDQLGRPNAATISIDDDANGVGWFIDITPGDSSEFTGTDTYFQATPNSPASGKYDLLTAILHEMGHTLGFINGYSQFNQNIKGRQFYTDPTHSYTLSSDLSHLDNTLYPNDLLNTNLKPGIRKLPSTMDWAIINAISGNSGVGVLGSTGVTNPAHLTAGALIGITNGDFTTPTTWNTTGATNIINGSATLTEQSQKLSELTQAFIIPTGAKTLQFTITDNHLVTGDTSKTANDAFEVALLDTNTFNPLAGTSIGLNHTDSLLNIQANGTIHKSDKVTITALGNNSSIVTIDLTQITPSTQATLYFNLLGFGARTSTVTIDDVKLFTDTQPIPVTKNDTLTTNQNTPLTLDPTQLTTNDTNVSQIQIINQPTHGTLTQTTDGKLTYQPIPTYIGNDSFTYLGFGTDGQISNLATVNLTVNNLPPTIETLTIPTTIAEGQNIQLSALAKDGGTSDNLTYTWNLGDGSNPITGQNIAHTYTDNGTYNVNLTVTDKDGGTTNQTTQIKVDNVAPTASITIPNTTLNQGESLNLGVNYSDPGTKDTHIITWNFDDGSNPLTLTPSSSATQPNIQPHTFTKAGNNNVTVTITDNDGATTTKAIQIAVTNIAPTITTLDIPTNINEGQSVTLTATASDPGNDTLTYNWYLNNATIPITGQTINYAFADNGIYPVKLDVIDSNGAITTQSVNVTVNNIAPAIVAIVKPDKIDEGQPVQFTATATSQSPDLLHLIHSMVELH